MSKTDQPINVGSVWLVRSYLADMYQPMEKVVVTRVGLVYAPNYRLKSKDLFVTYVHLDGRDRSLYINDFRRVFELIANTTNED